MRADDAMARSERVAWITGASSGIGRAVALELARRGWTVAATARREAALEALALESAGLDGRIIAHAGDVADAGAMAEIATRIEAAHGPIALAFLNAGISPPATPDFDADAARRTVEINVLGMIHSVAAVWPRMAARRSGRLVANASLAGYGGLPGAAGYCASKAAVIALFEGLRFDGPARGIVVQVVNPGFVATPLTAKNRFPMPFLMSDAAAARRIVDGFARESFEIAFPRRLAWLMKALRWLPYPLYFRLLGMAGRRR